MKKSFIKRSLVLALALVFVLGTVLTAAGAPEVRVFVEYRPGQAGAVRAALQSAGAEFHYQFDKLQSFVVTVPERALAGLQRNPNVVAIELDPVREIVPITPAAEIEESVLTPQVVPYGVDMVQARLVWDKNFDLKVDKKAPTGAGRTVCIIDTGFYTDHEDFVGVDVVGGYSQTNTDTSLWTYDGYGHGTHVAGTITAANNDYGVVGVTPGTVSLFIVKIFGDDGLWVNQAHASDLVEAAYLCQEGGANIISMSLGGGNPTPKEERTFQELYDAGILVVAAAGNTGLTEYHYPASYPSVISVAAIDSSYTIADFSTSNDDVELAAPGVAVLSTVPFLPGSFVQVDGMKYLALGMEYASLGDATGVLVDGGRCLTADTSGAWSGKVVLCERGDATFLVKVTNVMAGGGVAAVVYNNDAGIFSGTLGEEVDDCIVAVTISQEDGQYLVANKLGAEALVSNNPPIPGSGYEAWNGTSMATPHVSAVAALIWSANPNWTNVQIREALNATAKDLGVEGYDIYFGNGLVQAKAALDYLGGGKPGKK